jgi:uncharacterized protein (DUF983 family)
MQETGTCPECNSSAISAQVNSGFKDLYKCENCGCFLTLIESKTLSKLAVGTFIVCILVAKIAFELADAPTVGLALFVLAFIAMIVQIIIGLKSLFKKRTFQKIIKP